MAKKPPAFQFYAKDWRSSPTVRTMPWKDRGIFIELLAAAWDTQKPGGIPLPLSLGAKVVGVHPTLLTTFLTKYPHTFVEHEGWLINDKLRQQWLENEQFQRVASQRGKKGAETRWKNVNASSMQEALLNDGSASAFASASAPVNLKQSQKHGQQPLLTASLPDRFDEFWNTYPKKVAKVEARRAWIKIAGANGHFSEIILGVEKWKASGSWDDPQFIPHPATFLNQKRWQDEIPKSKQEQFDERFDRVTAKRAK